MSELVFVVKLSDIASISYYALCKNVNKILHQG